VGKEVELSIVLPQGLVTLPLRARSVDPVNEVYNEVHFCVVLQCVFQPIVVCWREPVLWNVLKFEGFWCP